MVDSQWIDVCITPTLLACDIMEGRPPTPPQESFDATNLVTQQDEDIDYHKRWLRSRGVDIDAFINKHNRVTIPIEEDIQVLIRFKQFLADLSGCLSADQAAEKFANQLQEQAEIAKRRSSTAAFKYYMLELPSDIHFSFLSFLRSKSSNSSHTMVYEVIPYLLDQINATEIPLVARTQDCQGSEECIDDTETTTSAAERVRTSVLKRTQPSFYLKRSENRTRAGSSIKKRSRSRKRKSINQGSEPVRRSSRLQKLTELIG